jgi:hypothetical protein
MLLAEADQQPIAIGRNANFQAMPIFIHNLNKILHA